MRILHIWDQAGVACILAKYQRKMGHDVLVLKRAGYDPFQIFQFYGELLLDLDGNSFLDEVAKKAKDFDVLHVHSIAKIVPELRKRYPEKTIVLHYHGSDVRRATKSEAQLRGEEHADALIGSTVDLKPFVGSTMQHIPNPVDIEHFKPRTSTDYERTDAFTFKTTDSDIEKIFSSLKESEIDLCLTVIDRQSNPLPYSEMPQFISRYGTYVDLKYVRGSLLRAPSKTGLECLASGLRVLDYNMEYTYKLHEAYMPERSATRMLEIYSAARG